MLKALTAISQAIVLVGCASAAVFAGCSASHPANANGVLPGAPGITAAGVNPFNLNTKNIVQTYPMPNPSTVPYYLAIGSDKNVWFTEDNAFRIGRITSSGVITEYPIPSGQTGYYIAAGSSGSLWFTESSNNIGKITTTGHITEYTVPASDSAAGQQIAKGPDGNMWFTDVNNNSIGNITPTGTVTEYLIPTASAYPTGIAAGSDGNLWFTEAGGVNSVGRITTGGTITEFPGPFCGGPVVSGPDGNLYAAVGGRGVCKITTTGAITSFPSGEAGGIAAVVGPDKQIWMTGCWSQPYLCEFNPKTGVFSNAIQPNPTYNIFGITVGGDGDLWIGGGGANDIYVYEEKITTVGIRLNGELSFNDPNYGFELGYAVGTGTQTQTISLPIGESVQFKNLDTVPHSAAFLGNATGTSAPWPASFNGSTSKSPAGSAIGTTGWATGSLNPGKSSPIYETGLPGFYMIGCQYHYNTNEMRTVVVVH